MRVGEFLNQHHVAFEAIPHPPAYSAPKRAKYLHIPGKSVAKSILLVGPEAYFLAILPSTHQIDTRALSVALGGTVRLANPREIADVFRDCEWGVVAPFGTLYGIETLIDETLNPATTLVFEGPTHGEAIRMLCRDFVRLERPRRLSFARLSPVNPDEGYAKK